MCLRHSAPCHCQLHCCRVCAVAVLIVVPPRPRTQASRRYTHFTQYMCVWPVGCSPCTMHCICVVPVLHPVCCVCGCTKCVQRGCSAQVWWCTAHRTPIPHYRYTHAHTHTHTHMHMHTHECSCVHMYARARMYTHGRCSSLCVRVCGCVCVCVYVCLCACV